MYLSRHQPTERNILAKVDIDTLQLLRVAVRRKDITSSATAPQPLERSIEDPANIVPLVHLHKDEERARNYPIFGSDIKVNQEFNVEQRFVLTDANRLEKTKSKAPSSSRSTSKSPQRRSTSPKRSNYNKNHDLNTRSRHSSRDRYMTTSNSRSKSPDTRPISLVPRYLSTLAVESTRRSRRSRDHSRSSRGRSKSSNGSPRDRSRSLRGRSRSPSDRSRSPVSSSHIRVPESDTRKRRRSRSLTPLKPGEYRPNHPQLKLRGRENNWSKRNRSRSPSEDYGSPNNRSKTPRKETRSPSGSYRHYSDKKSSSKPYSRKPSKSPSRYDPSRRSRSPRDYRSREGSVRSRSSYSSTYSSIYSKGSRSSSSSKRSRSPPLYHGELMPAHYGVYDPEYWTMTAPIRPGFAAPYPRFYPPMYPRPMIPAGAHMMFPRMNMHHYPFPRQQLPNYNSGTVKPTVRSETLSSATTSLEDETKKLEDEKEVEEKKDSKSCPEGDPNI